MGTKNQNNKITRAMAYTERTTTEFEKATFKYLNVLRNEGMQSYIAVSTLQKKWPDLETQDAMNLLTWWNENYNEEGDYTIIRV